MRKVLGLSKCRDYANGVPSGAVVQMIPDQSGLLFSAWWDSSAADIGRVFVHIRTTGPQQAAQDFAIDLLANPANPPILPGAAAAAGKGAASAVD
jgi:hypothetical protein